MCKTPRRRACLNASGAEAFGFYVRGAPRLKNPDKLTFRGAEGDEESRTSILFRARFLAALGMTRLRNVFQQTAKGDSLSFSLWLLSALSKLNFHPEAIAISGGLSHV